MLRDKNLIPLSHQHQHALGLCVRIERASPIAEADLPPWQLEVAQLFKNEIAGHFAAEEQVIFPAARKFRELEPLVSELLAEHAELRETFARTEEERLSSRELARLARLLSNHIRKEERQLFETLQQLLSAAQLRGLGDRLDLALKSAAGVCIVPSRATRLRSRRENPRQRAPGRPEENG